MNNVMKFSWRFCGGKHKKFLEILKLIPIKIENIEVKFPKSEFVCIEFDWQKRDFEKLKKFIIQNL